MKARAVFTLLAILGVFPLVAQYDTVGTKLNCVITQRHGRWDFGAGAKFSFLDFEEMNRALEAIGLPGLESPVPCLAVAVRSSFSWNRWLMESGLEYSFGASKKYQADYRRSVIFRDYGLHTRVLYDAFRRNRLSKIFPYAGLGISYEVLRTRAGASNAEAADGQRLAQKRFAYVPLVCEFGLSLEQGIKMRNRDVFVGIRGGYSFRFLQTQWDLVEGSTVDLPKPAAAAPFAAMMIRIKPHPKQRGCEVIKGN